MESNKKTYSVHDIKLDSLAMERAKLNIQLKEIKAKLDNVNNQIKEELGDTEDYYTEYYHFTHKIVTTPEHIVKESSSRQLRVYG